MVIRITTPEEFKQTREIAAIAFEYAIDNNKTSHQMLNELAKDNHNRDSLGHTTRWAAFEDDNTTLMGMFAVRPYPARFDGNPIAMAGIGDVATLPQYRRRGCIRGCFQAALPHMYQTGMDFSYLYPFSTAYYRSFGYELACERMQYTLELSSLRPVPVSGSCQLAQPEKPLLNQVKEIYAIWQNQYNLMVENERFEYEWANCCNPAHDQQYTYVYTSAEGQPKAYLTMALVLENNERNLHCSRFVFADAEGFNGLMNLVASLASDHRRLVFQLPLTPDISPLLPEWAGTCRRERLHAGMARVVNVRQVLQKARYKDEGQLVMQINDPYIPQNSGVFVLTFSKGQATNIATGTGTPEVTLGIGDFTRLITGCFDPASVPFMGGVSVLGSCKNFSSVFYPKPALLLEYF